MKTHLRDKTFEASFVFGVDIVVLWSWHHFGVLSVGDSIESFFDGGCTMFPIAILVTRFPSAAARVYCLPRPDFLVGGSHLAFSGVFFLFTRFGVARFGFSILKNANRSCSPSGFV